jgi:hypothetical protein
MSPVVYHQAKLTHTGVVIYKTFDGIIRKVKDTSLKNLIQVAAPREERTLNVAQSRKVKSACNKLSYYTQTRVFTSKASGTYRMKVAFLTLTAPDGALDSQVLSAFEHFLDYLRRTANCHYVWKKELGEHSQRLHFHIIVNNFIPHYIVSWKWKRLLIAEGVTWPSHKDGREYKAHTRIEMPRSKKAVGNYIAKYMSKAYPIKKEMGYVWGQSEILKKLGEVSFIEGDTPWDELHEIAHHSKCIGDDFVSILCCDLLTCKPYAPLIGALFEDQYIRISDVITLPQKFHFV